MTMKVKTLQTMLAREANFDDLETQSRGAPVQQDIVDLTIHHRITQ